MKRWSLRFALLAAVLIVGFALCELAVRVAAPPSLQPAILQPEAGAAFFGAGMLRAVERDGVRYAGRPHAEVTVHGIEYRHNRLGLRGPDVAPVAAPGTYRIALVGDSNAYGWGVQEVDSLRAQLELALAALPTDSGDGEEPPEGEGPSAGGALTPRQYEVIAVAFPGYNSADQATLLEQLWPDLAPDLVLVAWFANDLERLGFHVDADHALFCDPLPLPDRLKPTLWHSHVYRLLSLGHLGRMQRSGTLNPNDPAPRSFSKQHLLMMQRFARAHEARFAILDVPVLEPSGSTQRMRREAYPFENASAWLRATAAGLDAPTLELLDAIENEPTALLWASIERNDHHPNAKAHRLFAAAIARFLDAKGLLAR